MSANLFCCSSSEISDGYPLTKAHSKDTKFKSVAQNVFLYHKVIMITPSDGSIFRVTGLLWGEFTGHRWIPLTKASEAEFDNFFYLRLNKRLTKQSRRRWLETPLCPLSRHWNDDSWYCVIVLQPPINIKWSFSVMVMMLLPCRA